MDVEALDRSILAAASAAPRTEMGNILCTRSSQPLERCVFPHGCVSMCTC